MPAAKDISGQKFGKLTALNPTKKRWYGSVVWTCKCDCGNDVDAAYHQLSTFHKTSCGCKHFKYDREDLTGKQFGSLTPTSKRVENGHAYWTCECTCGATVELSAAQLVRKRRKSCGAQHVHWGGRKHGQSRTGKNKQPSPTYVSWSSIRGYNNKRTTKKNLPPIYVDPRWKKFENFRQDMGEKPEGSYLARKDLSLGYTPDNCYWRKTKNSLASE